MTCNVSEMWGKKMPEGLDLEISHHPRTMKHVVNLIIALERLKAGRPESVISTDFRDENLLNIMLESIVEGNQGFLSEPIQCWSQTDEDRDKNNITNQACFLLFPERFVFERRSAQPQFRSTVEYQCNVSDSQKRSLVLVKNSMELHAVMLQGGSENRKGECKWCDSTMSSSELGLEVW